MDLEEKARADTWTSSSSYMNELQKKPNPSQQRFPNFSFQQDQQEWENPSILDFSTRIEPQFRIPDQQDVLMNEAPQNGSSRIQDWDPSAMLNNLSFMEQKIHQLQDLVHLIVGREGQVVNRPVDELAAQQRQLITADLTSIIVQLISTAGSLLPSVRNSLSSGNQLGQQLNGLVYPSGIEQTSNDRAEPNGSVEEHDTKDEEDADEGENLAPGSFEILQLEKEEILAPHTHFCTICGKGFKRDANLRMHMRGHGDEYKSPAALAKPSKESNGEPVLIKRYSCPSSGCKRNKDHKKFQPLKTILCVKNHYKRTHCDKSYICSRCNTKKFSVVADLKTHEKHCGKDKWLCSCGTTFSRKDKLFGHIALFQGHTPAIPFEEAKGSAVANTDHGESNEVKIMVGNSGFNESTNDPTTGYYSPLNFETCNLSGFHEFPRPPFEDSESSFSFLISGSDNYHRAIGGESSSNDLQ